jgi:hypothetical protein
MLDGVVNRSRGKDGIKFFLCSGGIVFQTRIKDQKYTNKDLPHSKKLDIVIVVDMLLTGFDSKFLNTLYVDKNLKHPWFSKKSANCCVASLSLLMVSDADSTSQISLDCSLLVSPLKRAMASSTALCCERKSKILKKRLQITKP